MRTNRRLFGMVLLAAALIGLAGPEYAFGETWLTKCGDAETKRANALMPGLIELLKDPQANNDAIISKSTEMITLAEQIRTRCSEYSENNKKTLAELYSTRATAYARMNEVQRFVQDMGSARQLQPLNVAYIRNYLMGVAELGQYHKVDLELSTLRALSPADAVAVENYVAARRRR